MSLTASLHHMVLEPPNSDRIAERLVAFNAVVNDLNAPSYVLLKSLQLPVLPPSSSKYSYRVSLD